MHKKKLSERDICTKFITPALERAGWDIRTQVREEYPIAAGRIVVRGKLVHRKKSRRADYVLFGHKHEEAVWQAERVPIESVFHSAVNFRDVGTDLKGVFGVDLNSGAPFVN